MDASWAFLVVYSISPISAMAANVWGVVISVVKLSMDDPGIMNSSGLYLSTFLIAVSGLPGRDAI